MKPVLLQLNCYKLHFKLDSSKPLFILRHSDDGFNNFEILLSELGCHSILCRRLNNAKNLHNFGICLIHIDVTSIFILLSIVIWAPDKDFVLIKSHNSHRALYGCFVPKFFSKIPFFTILNANFFQHNNSITIRLVLF